MDRGKIPMTNLYDDLSLEELSERIKNMQEELTAARKEYNAKRTANLRSLMEARRETDRAIQEEMMNLGYKTFKTATGNIWSF